MYQLIDGKALAAKLREEIAVEIANYEVKPKLVVVIVGEDPASQVYVASKERNAKKIGMDSEVIRLDDTVTQDEINQGSK